MGTPTPDAMAVFDRAAEIEAPADREAYPAAACAGAPDVRRKVDALLRADARAGSFLDEPAVLPADPALVVETETADDPHPAAAAGTVVAGRYKLLQQIGEAGMGTVWEAQQTEPVKRRVAVKFIKAGMDSKQVLARFEAERQALALMDHPHIAKFFDAGATDGGHPFFVMELVKGVPLTEFCDERRLSVGDRLRLFQQVCGAVQHAHQKGIIHRDLKPSNILVEGHDGKPVPKVIDFGLAKATGGLPLTEHTLFTALGAVAGTPLYMAPEQATFNAVDVDTRADIYALGVILYELLTGTTPIERETFKAAAFDEMMRMIRHQDPVTPSTRLSGPGSKADVAAMRQTEPAKLGRFVRGELDWIVMKALAKERDRRYESATAFARDVGRFLNHEPVQAGPPSAGYRLRKFARRHRTASVLTVLIATLVLAGTGVSTWQAVRATRAEGEAGRRLAEANAERDRAGGEERRANQEAAVAQAVSNFLGDLLNQANPNAERDRDLKLRTVLDRAAQRIEGQFGDKPLVEAKIRMTIGATYRGLGLSAAAEPHVDRAATLYGRELGPDHRLTLRALNSLAVVYQDQEKYDRAQSLKEHVWRRRADLFGERDPDTLLAMNNLADLYRIRAKYELAERMLDQVVAAARDTLGPTHLDTLRATGNLAACLAEQGKYDRAEGLLVDLKKKAQARSDTDPLALTAAHNLGCVYREQGKYRLAEKEFAEALTGRETRLSPKAPDVAATLMEMGVNDLRQKKYVSAERRFRRCVAILEEILPDSWQLSNAYGRLGASRLGQGEFADAERLLLDGYRGMVRRKDSMPADEADGLMDTLGWLAELYAALGKPDEAAKWRAERATYNAPVEKGSAPRERK